MSFEDDKITATRSELLSIINEAGKAWQTQSSNMWGDMKKSLEQHSTSIALLVEQGKLNSETLNSLSSKVDDLKSRADVGDGSRKGFSTAFSVAIVFIMALIGSVYALNNERLSKLETAVFPSTHAQQ